MLPIRSVLFYQKYIVGVPVTRLEIGDVHQSHQLLSQTKLTSQTGQTKCVWFNQPCTSVGQMTGKCKICPICALLLGGGVLASFEPISVQWTPVDLRILPF